MSAATRKILAIYYTQSGQMAEIMRSFTTPLVESGASVETVEIKLVSNYNFPWTGTRFFSVMPSCECRGTPGATQFKRTLLRSDYSRIPALVPVTQHSLQFITAKPGVPCGDKGYLRRHHQRGKKHVDQRLCTRAKFLTGCEREIGGKRSPGRQTS